MPRRRKVEVFKLTISGLPEGQGYAQFLTSVRRRCRTLSRLVMSSNDKSHALQEVSLRNNRLRMRFLSFRAGYRPDILDTEGYSISQNPLAANQTGIEWTHAIGGLVEARFVLLVEKVQGGIFPSTIEKYLQWMIDELHRDRDSVVEEDEVAIPDGEPVTVSLEAEPGDEFLERIDGLDKVTKATLRTVRPNPGWADLETELAEQSQDSDAHKTDVTMTARRKASLDKNSGIIAWIKRLFEERRLDYAAVEGKRGEINESFNTSKLGKYEFISIELDDRGQIDENDAWRKLSEVMDNLK